MARGGDKTKDKSHKIKVFEVPDLQDLQDRKTSSVSSVVKNTKHLTLNAKIESNVKTSVSTPLIILSDFFCH